MKHLLLYIMILLCAVPGMAQTYAECVDSADYYNKREMWDDAERMTVKALRQKPAFKINYILWSNLGDIRTAKGECEEALQAFEIALTSAPDKEKPRILNNRAYTLLKLGKDDEALIDMNESVSLDSVQEWPLKMRGIINLNRGKYSLAEKDFRSLQNHYPRNASAYTGLGKIEASKGNSDKAIEYLRKSLELEQEEETWFYLVLINIENDKLPQAKEDLLVALKRYPRAGNLYLLRGLLHKKNYENREALIDKKIAQDFGADPHLVERFFPATQK